MENKLIGNEKDIIFYTDEDGNTKIQVILQNEDVCLIHKLLLIYLIYKIDIYNNGGESNNLS